MMSRIREVVDMNVCWQQAYNELMGKVSQLEDNLRESNKREVELINRVDSILTESNRREVEFAKKVDGLLEDISLLKIQALTYKEDFDIERRQRTEQGGKLVELQQELTVMQQENKKRAGQTSAVYCLYRTDTEEQPLYCPRCNQSFTIDNHDKLLEHMDICDT